MKRFLNILAPALFVVAMLATAVDMSGVADNIPVLSSIVDFLAFGGFAGSFAVSPAVADPGPGYVEGAPITAGEGHNSTTKDYLKEDINKEIVKIRPNDTPLDTLTRNIGNSAPCHSWEAGGWEIGVRDVIDKLAEAYTASSPAVTYADFKVTNRNMWKTGDVFYLMDSSGAPIADGGSPAKPLAFTVRGNGSSASYISVHRISSDGTATIPSISISSDVFMARLNTAVSELAAKTAAMNMNPAKRTYYNQTHMTMVEESVIHGLYKKDVTMDFSTYQEQTLWDFRRGMELTHLFGVGGISYNSDNEMIHLATGLWNQCSETSTYVSSTLFTDQKWNDLCKDIFEGNNGSDRRFLFAGSNLLSLICGAGSYSKQLEAKNTEIVMGVRVNKIETPFGELLVKPMHTLFAGGRANYGLVLDMNYVKKYVMEPMQTKEMDFDATGEKRVKAVRLLETCSLFLENLPVHRRIIPA